MAKTLVKIQKTDMSDEMQREALQVASLAVNMYEKDNDIARYIVTEFDRRHQPSWHCIVGNCGCYVQNQPNSFICFYVGDKRMFLFRTG